MEKNIIILIFLFFVALFSLQPVLAQEETSEPVQWNETDPTVCGGDILYISDIEGEQDIWSYSPQSDRTDFLWDSGGTEVEVECLDGQIIVMSLNEDGLYTISSPESLEMDILSTIDFPFDNLQPDGQLFQVSGGMLWFTTDYTNIWGLFHDDSGWNLLQIREDWSRAGAVTGLVVSESMELLAVQFKEGAAILPKFDQFFPGGTSLFSITTEGHITVLLLCRDTHEFSIHCVNILISILNPEFPLDAIKNITTAGNNPHSFVLEVETSEGHRIYVTKLVTFEQNGENLSKYQFVPISNP